MSFENQQQNSEKIPVLTRENVGSIPLYYKHTYAALDHQMHDRTGRQANVDTVKGLVMAYLVQDDVTAQIIEIAERNGLDDTLEDENPMNDEINTNTVVINQTMLDFIQEKFVDEAEEWGGDNVLLEDLAPEYRDSFTAQSYYRGDVPLKHVKIALTDLVRDFRNAISDMENYLEDKEEQESTQTEKADKSAHIKAKGEITKLLKIRRIDLYAPHQNEDALEAVQDQIIPFYEGLAKNKGPQAIYNGVPLNVLIAEAEELRRQLNDRVAQSDDEEIIDTHEEEFESEQTVDSQNEKKELSVEDKLLSSLEEKISRSRDVVQAGARRQKQMLQAGIESLQNKNLPVSPQSLAVEMYALLTKQYADKFASPLKKFNYQGVGETNLSKLFAAFEDNIKEIQKIDPSVTNEVVHKFNDLFKKAQSNSRSQQNIFNRDVRDLFKNRGRSKGRGR